VISHVVSDASLSIPSLFVFHAVFGVNAERRAGYESVGFLFRFQCWRLMQLDSILNLASG